MAVRRGAASSGGSGGSGDVAGGVFAAAAWAPRDRLAATRRRLGFFLYGHQLHEHTSTDEDGTRMFQQALTSLVTSILFGKTCCYRPKLRYARCFRVYESQTSRELVHEGGT